MSQSYDSIIYRLRKEANPEKVRIEERRSKLRNRFRHNLDGEIAKTEEKLRLLLEIKNNS